MKFLPPRQCVPQSHLSEDGIIVQYKSKLPALRRLNIANMRIKLPRRGGGLAAILGDDLTIGYLLRRYMVSRSKRLSEQLRSNFVTSRRLVVGIELAHINCVISPCVSFPHLNCYSRRCPADADADYNTEYHVDGDPEYHADGDTDSHDDGDAECHADGDAECHADGDGGCHADGDAECHADGDTDCHADGDTDCHADGDTDCHADGDAEYHADGDANCNADGDADCHADGGADCHADGDADCHADSNAECHADGDADCHADADCHSDDYADDNGPRGGIHVLESNGFPGFQNGNVCCAVEVRVPTRGL